MVHMIDTTLEKRLKAKSARIGVIGLGYVGLPLAVEFGKRHRTIGFDLSAEKVASYRRHLDPTGEVSTEELRAATRLEVGADPAATGRASVAVPSALTIGTGAFVINGILGAVGSSLGVSIAAADCV
mgnify:CR=1 FL=1